MKDKVFILLFVTTKSAGNKRKGDFIWFAHSQRFNKFDSSMRAWLTSSLLCIVPYATGESPDYWAIEDAAAMAKKTKQDG